MKDEKSRRREDTRTGSMVVEKGPKNVAQRINKRDEDGNGGGGECQIRMVRWAYGNNFVFCLEYKDEFREVTEGYSESLFDCRGSLVIPKVTEQPH